MSTKLSTDMIYNKSSTRLHAPPGGASTIFFGDYEPPTKTNVVKHEVKPGIHNKYIILFIKFYCEFRHHLIKAFIF